MIPFDNFMIGAFLLPFHGSEQGGEDMLIAILNLHDSKALIL